MKKKLHDINDDDECLHCYDHESDEENTSGCGWAVGESSCCSSMEALSWALKHSVTPNSTTVSLVHVFPQVKLIPTPCKFFN
ncbi:hypothetical protein TSUD_203890 [Trifolium subterraneum]|uniref:UspA domain-containing protein n=1 Tax=Trifolium subterraneum TaxID=3900 RepID=A0A2Z6M3T1_TRISU|nr:hypothetical protein TSUD_203890 [Trifolium subterraneum]